MPLIVLVSCGSSGGGNPTTPAVLTVEAHGGSIAPSTVAGSCNSGFHKFVAQEGTISVRLDATNAPSQTVSLQICPGSDIPGQCTVSQETIAVGQTLSGPRNGGTGQTLKRLRQDCVSGTAQGNAPIAYSTTLTYLK